MNNDPVIVEALVDSPVETVWNALTDKDKMKAWYFDLEQFDPKPGFEFRFAGKGHKGEAYTHICKIIEAIPNQKLQHSWKYENYPGSSVVTFDLFKEQEKTRVRVTHEGLENFLHDNPDFAKESFLEGWTMIITQSLKNYLEK